MILSAQSKILPTDKQISGTNEGGYFGGKFLIAGPAMGDRRFRGTVIYLCVHDADQAMGIIINKPKPDLTLSAMLPHLDIEGDVTNEDNYVLHGGPVEVDRGFVLHSRDYFNTDTSLPLSDTLALSTSKDILTALVSAHAPKLSVLALGYTGWHSGQLEDEIKNNGWLIADADEDMIFGGDPEQKWKRALATLGISPELLSAQAGSA